MSITDKGRTDLSGRAIRSYAELMNDVPLAEVLRTEGEYAAGEALLCAMKVALRLDMPLLLEGEPGTGKSSFAAWLAQDSFEGRLLEMQVKSTFTREDFLYRIDELARFRDAQAKPSNGAAFPHPLVHYLRLQRLGQAVLRGYDPKTPLVHSSGTPLTGNEIELDDAFGQHRTNRIPCVEDLFVGLSPSEKQESWVLLIDEIDKAPRDTPNDLLEEIETMCFAIPELGVKVAPAARPSSDVQGAGVKAPKRPFVILTSNNEKTLPQAFLRRCAYHFIEFPETYEGLERIISSRLGNSKNRHLSDETVKCLIELFLRFRSAAARKPGIDELFRLVKLYSDIKDTGRTAAEQRAMLMNHAATLAKDEVDRNILQTVVAEFPAIAVKSAV